MRAGVLLVEGDRVALIRRTRPGEEYYVFPGGGVEAGETPEAAAAREAYEELGGRVRIGGLAALVRYGDREQRYYRATAIGGAFGSGTGEELGDADAASGGYAPAWVRLGALAGLDVRPEALARALAAGTRPGEGARPLLIAEPRRPRGRT